MASAQELLEQTLNPATTKQAEKQLVEMIRHPGQLVALFQLILGDGVPPHIQLAGTLFFKNQVKNHWPADPKHSDEPDYWTFAEEEKTVIRENIVEAIARAPPLIRTHLILSLSLIGTEDYPAKLPNVVTQIMAHITNGSDEKRMIAGLIALKTVLQLGDFVTSTAKSSHRTQVISETFPTLLSLFQSVASAQSEIAYCAQHWLMKLLYAAFSGKLPPYWLQGDNFQQWMQTAGQVMSAPIPPQFAEEPSNGDNMSEAYKAKKWILHTIHRIQTKYATPVELSKTSPEMKQFQETVATQYLPVFATVAKDLALQVAQGVSYPPRFYVTLLTYVGACSKVNHTVQAIKGDIPALLFQVLFPMMQLTPESMETFMEDPLEYVTLQFDYDSQISSPSIASVNAWTAFCKINQVRSAALHFLTELLTQHASTAPGAAEDVLFALHQKKEAALYALGAFSDIKKKTKAEQAQIEQLIREHVFPELKTNNPILKARVLWLFTRYPQVKWSDAELSALAETVVQSLSRSLPLPVRVEAGSALNGVLKNDDAVEMLHPVLGQLLEELLNLLKDFGSEYTVSVLSRVITTYGTDVAPYAVQLCARLPEMFAAFGESDGPSEEAVYAAESVLDALQIVLSSLSSRPDLIPEAERYVLPFVHGLLNRGIQDAHNDDFVEASLGVLACLLEVSQEVSVNSWVVFPLVCETVLKSGLYLLESAFPVIDKYVRKGAATLVTSPEAVTAVTNLINEAVSKGSPDTILVGCKLFRSLTLTCPGKVDETVQHLTLAALSLLSESLKAGNDAKRDPFNIRYVNMVADAIAYNPQSVIALLESNNATESFFTTWFTIVPKYKIFNDKKSCVVALISVLFLGPGSLPKAVQDGLPVIATTVVNLLTALLAERPAREKRRKMVDEWEDEDEDDFDFDDLIDDFDEDDVLDDPQEMANLMNDLGAAAAAGNVYETGNKEATFDVNDFEERFGTFDGPDGMGTDDEHNTKDLIDLVYPSPLDDIDEVNLFFEKCNQVQAGGDANSQAILELLNGLSAQVQELMAGNQQWQEHVAAEAAKKAAPQS